MADAGDPVRRSEHFLSRITFIAALQYEAGMLRRAGFDSANVLVSGPGQSAAATAARRALEAGAEGLVSFGLAGGLEPAAATGSLVLADRVLGTDSGFTTSVDWRSQLVAALAGRLPVIEAGLCTVDATVTTPAAKRELAARTGACAVDMESAAIARVAAEASCPFVVIRAVADGVDDRLPDRVDSLVSANGSTRYAALLPFLWSPGQFGLLLRLGRNSRRARLALQQAASACRGIPL